MIGVAKGKPPAILSTGRGRRLTDAVTTNYAADSAAYDAGARTFTFDSSVYGAKTVKAALIKAQSGKCAFCESKFTHVAYGDVDHYRPKAGYVSDENGQLRRPGYYWLAYEWRNLYASCQICNQRFKKNWFPLVDEAARARNHLSDIAIEMPLLLDPGGDEAPDRHIEFAREVPRSRGRSNRGQTTIRILGLDRFELNDARLALYRKLDKLAKALRVLESEALDPGLQDEIRDELRTAARPQSEYSLMARCLLVERNIPLP